MNASTSIERTASFIDFPNPECSSAISDSLVRRNEQMANERSTFFAQLREMAMTPSPVANVLADPTWIRALTPRPRSRPSKHSSKSHKSPSASSASQKSESTVTDASDTPMLLSMVFNAEERQTNDLKMLLRSTGDRLELELQRADAEEKRAEFAEDRVRQMSQRLASYLTSQHEAELKITKLAEEAKRFQLMIGTLQAELERAQSTIGDLETRKRRAETDAREAREAVREFDAALNEERALNRTRLGNRFVDGVIEGRSEGYETAKRTERENRQKIYDSGFEAGREEGYEEGRQYGRAQERRKAMEAFDTFLEKEGYMRDE
ncbi:hypothetical protein BU17DRAFT_60208 [Hysterangium stoloniferum]|nr:hypothetical protein BU17DRAFT_60208 [Hysterangium stoloniferum]